jgi:glycosyltransferase involved in cell wall biosynthesis
MLKEALPEAADLSSTYKGRLAYKGYTRPQASIVVPAYNEQARIGRTLASLVRATQHTRKMVEVIIVDNASTDDTAGIAEYYGARVTHKPEKGVSKARQAGLEAAEADILLGTDADTEVPDEWIDAHLRHYGDMGVVGVAGHYEFAHQHPVFLAIKGMHHATFGTVRKIRSALLRKENNPQLEQSGSNFSYRRSVALAVGYEPGQNYGEDYFMSRKLRQHGDVILDTSSENTVITDGRRMGTPSRALRYWMKHYTARFGKRVLGIEPPIPKDFEDVR